MLAAPNMPKRSALLLFGATGGLTMHVYRRLRNRKAANILVVGENLARDGVDEG